MKFEAIIDAIKAERCLPFLGAGASACYSYAGLDHAGVPLGGVLGKLIADECNYKNGATFDLAKVAEYFVFKKSGRRDELENLIKREVCRVTDPRPIHTVLAQLQQIRFVLTSNYDTLLEQAMRQFGRELTNHNHDLQNPKTGHFRGSMFVKPPGIVLHKMHGTVEQPRSMVITQSDYIRYLANLNDLDRGMPEFFRKTVIPEYNLLFLGYSLEDWNFRVIWEGVLAAYRDAAIDLRSYALMRDSTEFQREFWLERKVRIIDCDLTEFAVELARAFNLDVPQLGIKKGVPATEGVSPL